MTRLKDPKLIFWTAVVLALMVASRKIMPVPLPHIQLPAEVIPGAPRIPLPVIGDFLVTNTIIAIFVTDVLLIALAVLATRQLGMVPSGLQNVFEAVIEWWENLAIQMVGEDLARRFLPLFLTLFLLVTLANWSELIPGYDTVGVLFQPEHGAVQGVTGGGEADSPAEVTAEEEGEHTFFDVSWTGEPGRSFGMAMRRLEREDEGHEGWVFVPFLRVASSDLSFTLALALISFFVVEAVGLQTLGVAYVRKFFNFDFSRGVGQGALNVFVGLLEFASELARIISFSFRLFGNLFAGQILLFVLPFLIPFAAVIPIFGLELFVGMIQGFVFAILTLAFMSVAIVSHDEHH